MRKTNSSVSPVGLENVGHFTYKTEKRPGLVQESHFCHASLVTVILYSNFLIFVTMAIRVSLEKICIAWDLKKD